MDPLTLMGLLSGGSTLWGLFNQKDPYKDYLKRLGRLANPQQIGADTNALFQQFLGSPAFSQMQGAAIGGSNALSQALSQQVGQQGLGGTGIGAAMRASGAGNLGALMQRVYGTGWQQSQEGAMRLLQARLSGLQGAPAMGNMGKDVFGAGLSGLGDLLRLLYARQNPQLFGQGQAPDMWSQ